MIEDSVLAKLAEIDPDLVRYAPLVDVILPVSIPDNELTSAMSGEIRGGNVRELLTRLLAFEASQAPMLIVMEDLHWFDSASWALLVDVQQKVRPLFLALNTRPLLIRSRAIQTDPGYARHTPGEAGSDDAR